MKWLNLSDVLLIHAMIREETGAVRGLVYPAGLMSALARPFRAFGGEALFPGMFDKLAALVHALIAYHPFREANERVALVAADVCLRLNGRRLAPTLEVEPYFWSIARGEQQVEQIAAWLEGHSEVLPGS